MRKLFVAMVFLVIGSSMALMAQSSKKASASTPQKKMLVTYFSVPERDGVDASTGASRIIADVNKYLNLTVAQDDLPETVREH